MKKIALLFLGCFYLEAMENLNPKETLAFFGFTAKSSAHPVDVHPQAPILQIQPRQVPAFIHLLYTLQSMQTLRPTHPSLSVDAKNRLKNLYTSVPKHYRKFLPRAELFSHPSSLNKAYATLKSYGMTCSISRPFFEETIIHIIHHPHTDLKHDTWQKVHDLHHILQAIFYVQNHTRTHFIDPTVVENLRTLCQSLPKNMTHLLPDPDLVTQHKKKATSFFPRKFLKITRDIGKIRLVQDYKILHFVHTYRDKLCFAGKNFDDLLHTHHRVCDDIFPKILGIEHPDTLLPRLRDRSTQPRPQESFPGMIHDLEKMFYIHVGKNYLSLFLWMKQPYQSNVRVYMNNYGIFCTDYWVPKALKWSELEPDLLKHYESIHSLSFWIDMQITPESLAHLVPVQDIEAWIAYDYSNMQKQNNGGAECYTTDRSRMVRERYQCFFENILLPAAENECPWSPALVPKISTANSIRGMYKGMTFSVARIKGFIA